jgi:hypothetical protein
VYLIESESNENLLSTLKMFEKALLLLLISALLEYSECACQKASTRPVKTYKIDLDKPARERFIQPASDFKNEIAALIEYEK